MKVNELFEAKKQPPWEKVLADAGLKRSRVKGQAELDNESVWDLDEDLQIHIINYGRKAVVYFEGPAPDDARGKGSASTRGWFMPVGRFSKAFVQRYPWLENLVKKDSFNLEKDSLEDFEEWVKLWVNRKK